ncbi:MAG TPA: hypothetical protein VK132_11140 [Gemmatimonadales bacterium]|nr:hypothetical protein [Gemmatimonadales bacterium]
MSRMVSVAALTALVAGPAVVNAQRPQRSWSPELGVQGGFSRFKASGTGRADQADFFDVPGFTLIPLVPASGATALYAIIPVQGKLALEPSFATSQLEGGTGNGLTLVTAGLRGDYALTRKVYAAVGATLGFVETAGQHETQLGVEAAVGYRLHLAGRLNGRLEANWQSTKNAKLLPPWNTYSVLFGISSRVTSGAADLSSPAAQAKRRGSDWQPAIGLQGGYQRTHLVGGSGDITIMSFPSWGSGLTTSPLGGAVAPSAPTLYVIVPVSTRLALEPGVDFHRTQFTNITVFSSNLAGRLDYAVSGGWYAGAGVNLHFIKATKGTFTDTSKTALSVPGANLGWGYRFHLSGELAGRVEINYTMFKQNSDLSQATNTVGLMVGAAMPLN